MGRTGWEVMSSLSSEGSAPPGHAPKNLTCPRRTLTYRLITTATRTTSTQLRCQASATSTITPGSAIPMRSRAPPLLARGRTVATSSRTTPDHTPAESPTWTTTTTTLAGRRPTRILNIPTTIIPAKAIIMGMATVILTPTLTDTTMATILAITTTTTTTDAPAAAARNPAPALKRSLGVATAPPRRRKSHD